MTVRVTNGALLASLVLLASTGVYGLFLHTPEWPFELHRIAAWVFVALLPWKAAISIRSLRRPVWTGAGRAGAVSLSLGVSILALVATALAPMWMLRLGPDHLGVAGYVDTVASWHWILGLILLPLLAGHIWTRRIPLRRMDWINRRGFLRLAGLGAAGIVGWRVNETLAGLRQEATAPRRYTGSRESGSFSPDFPVTTGAGDGRSPVDVNRWRLLVSGAVRRPLALSYPELLHLPRQPRVATLDCTVGWWSQQRWEGVHLLTLLEMAGLAEGVGAVKLAASEGYSHRFTMEEAGEIVLATHVAGAPLSQAHGFPVRAVSPRHRGWFWIKWLERIEVEPRRQA